MIHDIRQGALSLNVHPMFQESSITFTLFPVSLESNQRFSMGMPFSSNRFVNSSINTPRFRSQDGLL